VRLTRAFSFTALTAALFPLSASASPWTLPRGTVALTGTFGYQTASQEFFDNGRPRNFPLRGRYTGTAFYLGVRASFIDGLEFELSVPIRQVTYTSDPVILLDRPMGSTESEIDYYQRNIINLSRAASGIGDLNLSARYRLVQQPFALAAELRIKAPTGYASPQGTFGDRPQTNAEFLSDVRRFVAPENVRDDVTLGDGQLDTSLGLLFGYAFRTRTFIRADAAYNLRFGGAGHQVLAALRAGQGIGDRLLLYAWAQLAYTVTQGRVVGVSVAAENPDVPADQYLGASNLLLRELRLERDSLDVGGGLIVRLTSEVELNLGYSRTLWGRNTAAVDSLSLGLGVRTRFMPGS
jgi:opacity protein-like surface antigen